MHLCMPPMPQALHLFRAIISNVVYHVGHSASCSSRVSSACPADVRLRKGLQCRMWRNCECFLESWTQSVAHASLLQWIFRYCALRPHGQSHISGFVSQIFNEINSRKIGDEYNIFEGLFTSKIFMGVLGITTILQIIIMTTPLADFFKVDSLEWYEWVFTIGIGLGMIPLSLLIRFVSR